VDVFVSDYKKVTIVVIGLNVERFLATCLQSINLLNYPKKDLEIIYVDSGSTDSSLEIASRFCDVKILTIKNQKPTAGRGRNAGWRAGSGEYVLFLDGDTAVDPDWLTKALSAIKEKVAAVCGQRLEWDQRKNWFHLINNIEWNCEEGEIQAFGGDVLIKRSVLESVNGYNDLLSAGEDPELSYRIRQAGWKIIGLPDLMTHHDIAMDSLSQYLRRSVRSGHAFAEVSWMHLSDPENFWLKETLRIALSSTMPWGFLAACVMAGHPWVGGVIASSLIFRSGRRWRWFKKEFNLSGIETLMYCTHLSLVVYPQALGVLKFHSKRLLRRSKKAS
jgi:GT2 family glycosyltransferase